jgi:hypothetical protein
LFWAEVCVESSTAVENLQAAHGKLIRKQEVSMATKMTRRQTGFGIFLFLAVALVCAPAYAEGETSDPIEGETLIETRASIAGSPWRYDFNVYFWFVDAPLTIKDEGVTIARLPEDFDTIWDALEFGAMFEVEAHKGPLGLFASPIYVNLKHTEHFTGPLGNRRKATIKEDAWLIDYGVSYEVGRWPLGKNSDTPTVTVEPYAGFRFLHDNISLKVDPGVLDPGLSKHYTLKFNTPIVGGRTSWDFSDRWFLNVSGDYGGWDVDHVKETYQGIAALGYRFTMWNKPATLFAGYRYLHLRYEKTVELDLDLKGPLIGIGWEF